MDERRRHMETAYRIDILARTGIILLLPLGLHMGNIYGLKPYGGTWLVVMRIAFAAWLSLTWSAFIYREIDTGLKLTKIDEWMHSIVIPLLLIAAVASLAGYGPFNAPEGARWYATKIFIYSLLLVIGPILRFVMREWTVLFRVLAEKGAGPAVENTLERSIRKARRLAYVYWIGIASVGIASVGIASVGIASVGIASVGILGAVKPSRSWNAGQASRAAAH